MNKKYVFFSPRSSGNTLISLNMALLDRQTRNNKKIAYLQLSKFPDAHSYYQNVSKHTILDLKYLIKAGEIKDTYREDTYPSPKARDWRELSKEDIVQILKFLEEHYDVVYIDIHSSVEEEILEYIFQKADKILLPITLDSISLAGLESFFSQWKQWQKKCHLLFNQCPPGSQSIVKHKLQTQDVQSLGTIPVIKQHLWSQLFEGIPVIAHRKSQWKKAFLPLLKKLTT